MTAPTDNEGGLPSRTSVLLSVQRALLDRATPSLRAVVVAWSGTEVRARCYFDAAISEVDLEEMSCAETEVMADFRPEVSVRFECIRVDAPNPINDEGAWAYARYEPPTSK